LLTFTGVLLKNGSLQVYGFLYGFDSLHIAGLLVFPVSHCSFGFLQLFDSLQHSVFILIIDSIPDFGFLNLRYLVLLFWAAYSKRLALLFLGYS